MNFVKVPCRTYSTSNRNRKGKQKNQAKELEHSEEQICTERLGLSKDDGFVGGSYLVELHHSCVVCLSIYIESGFRGRDEPQMWEGGKKNSDLVS